MAVKYGFYNAIEHDRLYSARDFGEMFDGLITDGIYATIGGAMAVVVGSGMKVIVRTGRAWFNCTWTVNTADMPITIEQSDRLLPRIDAVILEVDTRVSGRKNSIKAITGSPALIPKKPTLSNTGEVYQYPLAYITVPQNSTSVSATNIENCIGNVTPFVTGILKSVSIAELWDQWKAQFEAWFVSIRSVLDGDVALNLQNNIDKCVKLVDKARETDLTSTNSIKWMTPEMTSKMIKNEMRGEFGSIISSSELLLESSGYYKCLSSPCFKLNDLPEGVRKTTVRNRLGFRYGAVGVASSMEFSINGNRPLVCIGDDRFASGTKATIMDKNISMEIEKANHLGPTRMSYMMEEFDNISIEIEYPSEIFTIKSESVSIFSYANKPIKTVCALHYSKNKPNDLYIVIVSDAYELIVVNYSKPVSSATVVTTIRPFSTNTVFDQEHDTVFLLGDYLYAYDSSEKIMKAYVLVSGQEASNVITNDVITFATKRDYGIVTSLYSNVVTSRTSDGIQSLIKNGSDIKYSYISIADIKTMLQKRLSPYYAADEITVAPLLAVYDEDDGYSTSLYGILLYAEEEALDYTLVEKANGAYGLSSSKHIENKEYIFYIGGYESNTDSYNLYPFHRFSTKQKIPGSNVQSPEGASVYYDLAYREGLVENVAKLGISGVTPKDFSNRTNNWAVIETRFHTTYGSIIPMPGNLPLSNGITDEYIYLPS